MNIQPSLSLSHTQLTVCLCHSYKTSTPKLSFLWHSVISLRPNVRCECDCMYAMYCHVNMHPRSQHHTIRTQTRTRTRASIYPTRISLDRNRIYANLMCLSIIMECLSLSLFLARGRGAFSLSLSLRAFLSHSPRFLYAVSPLGRGSRIVHHSRFTIGSEITITLQCFGVANEADTSTHTHIHARTRSRRNSVLFAACFCFVAFDFDLCKFHVKYFSFPEQICCEKLATTTTPTTNRFGFIAKLSQFVSSFVISFANHSKLMRLIASNFKC